MTGQNNGSALTAPHSQPTLGLMSTDLTSAADFCHFCYVSLKWGDTNVSPCQLLTETPRRDTAVPWSMWKHVCQHTFLAALILNPRARNRLAVPSRRLFSSQNTGQFHNAHCDSSIPQKTAQTLGSGSKNSFDPSNNSPSFMLAFNTCHLPGWRTDVKHIDELFRRQAKVYCDKETDFGTNSCI